MHISELNIALCKALNIDHKDVIRVTLVIEAGAPPRLMIDRHVRADSIPGIAKSIQSLELFSKRPMREADVTAIDSETRQFKAA